MTNSKAAKQEARRLAIQASQFRINLLASARALCSLKSATNADHARGLEMMDEWRRLTGYVG
jgi:hypothetical protein